jgi:hypothetical protein
LWGQEENSIRVLREIKNNVTGFLFRKRKKWDFPSRLWLIFTYLSLVSDEIRDKYSLGLLAMGKLILLDRFLSPEKFLAIPEEEIGLVFGQLQEIQMGSSKYETFEQYEKESKELWRTSQLEVFFETVEKAGGLVPLIAEMLEKKKSEAINNLENKVEIIGVEEMYDYLGRQLETHLDGARGPLHKINRSKKARGGWFIFLTVLYTVTITFGLTLLSSLKKGTCEIQASCIAVWPLGLTIIALAFTFIYLYYVVRGGKDA